MELGGKIYALIKDKGGLKIIEITDPKNPVRLGSIEMNYSDGYVTMIEIGEIIYALVNSVGGLKINDVSDP